MKDRSIHKQRPSHIFSGIFLLEQVQAEAFLIKSEGQWSWVSKESIENHKMLQLFPQPSEKGEKDRAGTVLA